jgi:dTDP-glucose 4,6-dehydratase
MDITKIGKDLGWKPRHSLTDGVQKTVEWYLAHPEWAAAIQKQQDYQKWIDQNYGARGHASTEEKVP